eukprot:jgi/Botrbrau1/15758/Bobra.4_1s0122.1
MSASEGSFKAMDVWSKDSLLELLLLSAITTPHLIYAFVWLHSPTWRRWCGDKAVQTFRLVAIAGKGLQLVVTVLWLDSVTKNFEYKVPVDMELLGIGIIATTVGQVLNVKTFDAIGAVGVYYGVKLGHRVEWNDGFPFNVVSHPQYVGSVLTVWGLLLGAKSIYPTIPLISTMVVGSYWTAMYVITGLIEQYL